MGTSPSLDVLIHGVFAPRLPHYFIQKFTKRGDVVLDPFSGRGTTPLQACVEGRIGIGIDANPAAYALTLAKVSPPDPIILRNRIDDLSNDMFFADVDHEPRHIKMLFEKETLRQLVFLKQNLNVSNSEDAFILATLLGMLHGGSDGGASKSDSDLCLSIAIPHTVGISPEAIAEYVQGKSLKPPTSDVFPMLRRRVDHLMRMGVPRSKGQAWSARIQDLPDIEDSDLRRKRVKLIVSSPPTAKPVNYGLHDWMRLWFLNESPEAVNSRLDGHRRVIDYLNFMADACKLLYRVMAPGGVCALAIGDIKRGNNAPILLAEEVWAHLKRKRTKWQLAQIVEDPAPRARQEEGEEGPLPRRVVCMDRVLVMYKDEYKELQERVLW